ncbi:MAG TPA: L-seryl-tRNA(Sec) selenium transferase [Acidimicrobiales bacterium]|nr:L-seryl-tRNA(Sec) selenium transferase [Acidimicrobiales bacterium]
MTSPKKAAQARPQVDRLARSLKASGLPHPLCVDIAREAIAAGDPDSAPARAEATRRSLLGPVINATGVLLHTNLGRAPHGPAAEDGGGPARYSNLEIDLATGRRGDRTTHAASLMAQLTGAEAALVVNNGAAALLLALAAVAAPRQVIVSRGELVEIGGGFRIPEVLAGSGAQLVEIGTTNRTHLRDYESALAACPSAAAVLKVHPSNYRLTGFTASVDVREVSRLGPPVIADIGSGLLDAATPWIEGGPPAWLSGEPAARQTLADGAALVTFSGDKLLGGPQAGILAGRRDLVDRCRRHPLARALRPGGLVLAELQRTALAYLARDVSGLPFWRMATAPVETLRARAAALSVGEIVDCESVPGGGSVPGAAIPSVGIAMEGDRTAELRALNPPIFARVVDGRTVVDLRTVDPDDDPIVGKALASL